MAKIVTRIIMPLSVLFLVFLCVLVLVNNAKLRYDNNQKESYIGDLKTSLEGLKSQNQQLQSQLETVNNEDIERFTSTTLLTSENEQLKQQLEKLRKDVDAQKALAQTHSEDANHLRKTISFLDDKFASEQKKLFSSNIKNEKIKKELIQLHKNLGHIKDARKLQKRRDSAMYYNLGISYIWSKRYQLAENALKKAVQLADDNADAWYNLALLYEEALDKPKDAKICYEKYLQLIPNSGETYDIQWRIMALE